MGGIMVHWKRKIFLGDLCIIANSNLLQGLTDSYPALSFSPTAAKCGGKA
jgi:hypothetical protein